MKEITITHLKPNAQKTESWIAMIEGEVVGHIYMEKEVGNRIKFLDAWVHEDHRRKGIFRMLWDTRWDYVNQNHSGSTIYAWCKETSLPLLIEKGFSTGEICTYVEKTI
jgi:GNAT superfamily N-acetyltransferase